MISRLEDYLRREEPSAPRASLSWEFERRPERAASEFRAVATFRLRGLPQSFGGPWEVSKKKAQREAAGQIWSYLSEDPGPSRGAPPELVELAKEGISGLARWDFESRLGEFGPGRTESHEFRAVVTLRVGDLPHSFCGEWKPSRREAQQDSAERVRRYLAERLGLGPGLSRPGQCRMTASGTRVDFGLSSDSALQELRSSSEGRRTLEGSGGVVESRLSWRFELESRIERRTRTRAIVGLELDSVPYFFSGSWCASREEALIETAKKVLWYLGESKEGLDSLPRSTETSARRAPGMDPGKETLVETAKEVRYLGESKEGLDPPPRSTEISAREAERDRSGGGLDPLSERDRSDGDPGPTTGSGGSNQGPESGTQIGGPRVLGGLKEEDPEENGAREDSGNGPEAREDPGNGPERGPDPRVPEGLAERGSRPTIAQRSASLA